jgi:hypothetical protein
MVKENGTGSAVVSVTAKAVKDTIVDGVYFCLDLPEKYYANAMISLNGSGKKQKLSALVSPAEKIRKLSAKSIIAESEKRQLSISFNSTSTVIVRKEISSPNYRIYIGIMGPEIKKEQQGLSIKLRLKLSWMPEILAAGLPD